MDATAQYGKRLLPQILDQLAALEPDRILYSIPKSSDIRQGFQHVTTRAFMNAVDKTAWQLRRQLGESATVQAVGYIGPHDLRQPILTYACAKAGYAILILSPKNSLEGALAVLEAAKCNVWIKPGGKNYPLVQEFLEKRAMTIFEAPELSEMLQAEGTEPFPYTKTFDEAAQDPFLLLHTSGSTGLPKPIVWTHVLLSTVDAVRLLPPAEGDMGMKPWSDNWNDGDTIYSSFPMSHGAGILMDIIIAHLFGLHCVLGPPDVIPNMDLIKDLAEHANIDIWSMIPSLADELGETPDVLAKFKSSKFICASGGPVSPVSAAKVNEVIRVLNLTGTTEGLFIGNLWVDREDWLYFAFHPYSGFEFKEVEPGIYEHWVHRNEHATLFQGIFHTFPDQPSVNFKDLYTRHPTKPDLWAYKGRNDDVVVLSNGYKISPLDTEALVTAHPAVQGCIVIGSGKTQAGLLIELKDPAAMSEELFDSIWTTIERANAISMHKNQFHKDYVAFSEPDKPFVRTDKSTIKRKATLQLYAEFIERFYNSRAEPEEDMPFLTLDTGSIESITRAVRHILASLLPVFKDAPLDANMFALGLDSLLVGRATKLFRAATGLGSRLTARHIYSSQTMSDLAETLARLLSEARSAAAEQARSEAPADAAAAELQERIRRYNARIGQKVTAYDVMCRNIHVGLNFYFPLREEGAGFEAVFARLQQGLRRVMEVVPELGGRVIECSEHEIGYRPGDLRLTMPPPSWADGDASALKQLRYKDLSETLPSYAELKAAGFLASACRDDVLLECPWLPELPTDAMVAQANFVKGGCILAVNIHHAVVDGRGAMLILRAWAEACRALDGGGDASAATFSWLHPESLNRGLLDILHELEGYARPAAEVDPKVWNFITYPNPVEVRDGYVPPADVPASSSSSLPSPSSLPQPPPFPRNYLWPPPGPQDGRCLTSSTFLLPAASVAELLRQVLDEGAEAPEPGPAGTPGSGDAAPAPAATLSLGDAVQAFIWRATARARYRVATEQRGETFAADAVAVCENVIDTRTQFSARLPETYIGTCYVVSRPYLRAAELVAPGARRQLARVARLFRDAAARVTPRLVHDAYTLMQQAIHDQTKIASPCQGLHGGLNCAINNLLLFSPGEAAIAFGGELFAGGGVPDAVRVQTDRFNAMFRQIFINPLRADGGVEVVIGTLPEELAMLMADEEFTRYASYLG